MARASDARQRLIDAALELIWSCSYGATSVDAICEKAGAKKGSFYHFFESKSALAVEALKANAEEVQPAMVAIFCDKSLPPADRFARFYEKVTEQQATFLKGRGVVLGCPLFSLGCEVCTQNAEIKAAVNAILEENRRLFEVAIADGHALGVFYAPDAAAKARYLFSFFEGTLAEARLENSLAPLAGLMPGTLEFLRV